jgi:hypothetical protein
MNFVGDVLKNTDGIQNFYIVGLLIFMTLFIIIIYRTVKIPRQDLVDYKTSIFENDEIETNKIK